MPGGNERALGATGGRRVDLGSCGCRVASVVAVDVARELFAALLVVASDEDCGGAVCRGGDDDGRDDDGGEVCGGEVSSGGDDVNADGCVLVVLLELEDSSLGSAELVSVSKVLGNIALVVALGLKLGSEATVLWLASVIWPMEFEGDTDMLGEGSSTEKR